MLHIICTINIAWNSVLSPYKAGFDHNTVKIPKEEISSFQALRIGSYFLELKDGTQVNFPINSCVVTRFKK